MSKNKYYTSELLIRPHLGRLISVLLLLVVGGVLAINRVSAAADTRLVQLSVGGDSLTVMSNAGTVGEVLAEADVAVGALDRVEPGLDSPVSGEVYHVNVYRARPVMIVDGARRITINTSLASPQLIAGSAGMVVYPEDEFDQSLVREFVDEGFIGEKLVIRRATPVVVNFDGHTFTLRTHRRSVGELLDEKGIVLSGEDFTTVPLETPLTPDLRFNVVRVGREVVTDEETIPYATRTIVDHDLAYGEIRVEQEGADGHVVHSYEVKRHNGVEVERILIGTAQISQPVPRIVVKGTRLTGEYVNNLQILAALRECETHSNYRANTGNGFYGAYQFMQETWNRTAQRMDKMEWYGVKPYEAPPATQDAFVLNNARASSGGFWSQHPGCSNYLHLPKFPFD